MLNVSFDYQQGSDKDKDELTETFLQHPVSHYW